MHYKNGRIIEVGDMVIGRTHNSEGRLRIGRVTALMPEQGPCNVKLMIICHPGTHTFGGEVLSRIVHEQGKDRQSVKIADDFADAKDIYRLDDAFKMIDAVYNQGTHNAPYSGVRVVD